MELRLPLEMSPGRGAACRAVLGTWGLLPNAARKNCPFALTSFTGWSSERCPGIGFLSRGDREIGGLRNGTPLVLQLLQQGLVDVPFTRLHGHQVPQVADLRLPDAVDAPKALLQPVGVPRQVVVH